MQTLQNAPHADGETGARTVSIKASLTAEIYEEKPGLFVSYCPELDLCSQGDSVEDAKAMIIEAGELFLAACIDDGTLAEVLAECGFRPHREYGRPPTVQFLG